VRDCGVSVFAFLLALLGCYDDKDCVLVDPTPGCLPVKQCCETECFFLVEGADEDDRFNCASPDDCAEAQRSALDLACAVE